MKETNSNKTLFKIAIPVLLIIVLLAILFMLFGPKANTQQNTNTSTSSKLLDVKATTKSAPEKTAKLSDKELEKKSQQFNSLLKQKRSSIGAVSGNELEFNWYMGYWDAESKKTCGIETPGIPSDAGSMDIPVTLNSLIPAPEKPIDNKKNRIVYERFEVDGPVAYPQVKDQFVSDEAGVINFNEKMDDTAKNSPMQQKLLEGATLLPIAPNPGELGNAFIQGHTSNFRDVISDWNYIFTPFQQKSEVGDEFFIYDCEGRKLIFDVFEAKSVREPAADEAWQDYPDRRVVTLQGCILDTREDGSIHPDSRWLTRGELNLEKTKEANNIK
jgi:sortase (surface protein transpeptidase)